MNTQCTYLKIDHANRVGYRARASSRARARSRAALCVDSRALAARARPRRRDTARHAFSPSTPLVGKPTRRAHASFHDAIRPGEARHPHRARDSTSAMSATTTRAATAAPCVRAAHRTTNKTVAQSHRARRFTVARAVVDSENTAADRGTDAPARPDVQLRPAGVSDAVVDSAKALEALAALGGNRAYIDAFARASRSRYTTSRGTRERDDDDASDRDSARYAGRVLIQRMRANE